MRLGILALLLSIGLVLPGSPAQARERTSAAEVVRDAIADADFLVEWARRSSNRDMTASLKRDRASLRDVWKSLRGDTTRAERRHASYVARSTIACSMDKGRYALRGPDLLRNMLAETAAASQAVRDAHGPDLPEEVEALLDEADAQSAIAATRLGWIVPAAAPVECKRPNASLVGAAMHYRSAEDAAVAGSSAALEAYELMGGPGDVIEADD